MDPVRDEDLIYEKVLRKECGVEAKLDVYPPWLLAFLPRVKKCRQAQRSHGCWHGLALGEDAQFEKN